MRQDDLAHGLALREPIERWIDRIHRNRFGQQFPDREATGAIHRNEARNIPTRDAGAHVAALDGAFLSDQAHRLQRPLRSRIGQPRAHRRSAAPRDPVGALESCHRTRHFKRVIDPPVGRSLDLGHDLRVARIEDLGCTEAARHVELGRHEVDRDHLAGAARHSRQQRRKPHAAQPDHGDPRTRLNPGRVEHGPRTGHDGAAK